MYYSSHRNVNNTCSSRHRTPQSLKYTCNKIISPLSLSEICPSYQRVNNIYPITGTICHTYPFILSLIYKLSPFYQLFFVWYVHCYHKLYMMWFLCKQTVVLPYFCRPFNGAVLYCLPKLSTGTSV